MSERIVSSRIRRVAPPRHGRARLIAAALVAALAVAWPSIQPAATAEAATSQLVGVVTDSIGAPLAGIRVELRPDPYGPPLSFVTGASGTYTFSDVPPGRYSLHCEDGMVRGPDQVGFSDHVWTQPGAGSTSWGPDTRIELVDGAARTIDVVMQRDATVTGTVVDGATGAPVSSTSITATSEVGGVQRHTTTDGAGRYAFEAPPGTFRIVPSSFVRPDAPGGRMSVTVTTRHGEHVEAPELRILAGDTVTGRIVDAVTGQPVAFATVEAVDPLWRTPVGGLAVTRTDGDGWFQLSEIPGEQEVLIRVRGPWSSAAYAEPAPVALTTLWETTHSVDFALELDADEDGVSDVDEQRNGSDPTRADAFPMTQRFGGADRFEAAVSISRFSTEPGAPLLLVNGLSFPDALAAGPAAATVGGGVLMVQPGTIPEVVAAEIRRVAPSSITVIGGPVSVSDAVMLQAGAIAGVAPTRIGGRDRFEVAVNVANAYFPGRQDRVLLANGLSFPDALGLASAGSMPGEEAPVLLTTPASLPASVRDAIDRMDPAEVVVAGGESSVAASQLPEIRAAAGVDPHRIGGADRYAVSTGIAAYFTPAYAPTPVIFASGLTFPDALVGSMLTARTGAPLLLMAPECVHARGQTRELGAQYRYIAGGPASIREGAVDRLC